MKTRIVKIDWETFSKANSVADRFKSKYSFDGFLKNRRILRKYEWVIGIVERVNESYVLLNVGCED